MAEFSQNNRRALLHTVLGPETLVLFRMDGDEELCGDFEWNVKALSPDPHLDLNQLLGTHATVSVESVEGTRYFDGIVAEARWIGPEDNGNRYDLTLRPWLHVAGLRRNNRIFHEQTVIEILETVLSDYAALGTPHMEVRVTEDYPKLEYTVQYNESDADFARRQMERFGITWMWEFSDGNHVLVLTDALSAHEPVEGETRPWYPIERLHQLDEEHFFVWQTGERMTTGAVRLTEYNFKTPNVMQEVDKDGNAPYAHGSMEIYEWPGDYLDPGAGQGVVARRMESQRGQGPRILAKGNISGLAAGLTVTITGQELKGTTGESFMCLKAHHELRPQTYGTGGAENANEEDYTGQYIMMPAETPLRPERRTPRPVIQGCQTAMVVGDGEIDCDEYGRILVRFHWDLEGANSMRCRVMQHSASNTYGGMVIPRIGMEAVVEFLEGDPDKPLVTGCVYNDNTPRPYDLPGHKTKHVIRADTHEGTGFNEISFEAQSGQENLHIHAQKDHTVKVLNDQTMNIGSHFLSNVGANASTTVGANSMERVGLNKLLTIGGMGAGLFKMLQPLVQAGGKHLDKSLKKTGQGGLATKYSGYLAKVDDMSKEEAVLKAKNVFGGSGDYRSDGGKDQHSKGSKFGGVMASLTKIGGSGTMNLMVEKFLNTSVGVVSSEHVGVGKNVVVGNVYSNTVGKMMTTLVGEEYKLEAKKKIFNHTEEHTLLATKKFTIAGPGGSITIDNSGVTIKSMHVVVKAPKVDFNSGASGQVKALSTDKPFAQECKG